jgi:hypothetical protein
LTSSHGVFDLSECNDEAMQLYAEVLCSEYSISPSVHPSGDEMTVNVRNESDIEEMGTYDCQSGWTYYNGNCYNFNLGTSYSWSGCNSKCSSLSASMLCITDSTTNSWIANKLYYNTAYSYSWIGYSDSSNTGYKWVSGCSSSYTNWNYYSIFTYDYAYMGASSGNWYTAYDTTYSSCSCQTIATSDDDSSSSPSAVTIVIIIVIVVGFFIFCSLFGINLLFMSDNNGINTVDSSNIDTSNNQEHGNGNIPHAFLVTNSQEYGHRNISPSFPVASVYFIANNQGIPVITSYQGIPVTSSNHEIPVTSSNNQVNGNITTF